MASLKGSDVPTLFINDSDEELLFFMAMKDEDPSAAEQAWAEFYSRHAEYLYGTCLCAHGRTLGESGAEDLVQNTFIRACEKANTFHPSDQKGNPNFERAHVRAWLGKIAENLLRDTFRRSVTLVLVADDELEVEDSRDDLSESSEAGEPENKPSKSRLLAEALLQLTDREQDILRLTGLWYCPGKELRIPSGELQKLASTYNTTPVTIRQIRKRAIEKVKTYVESKENTTHQQRGKTAHA
jgi:RNA polymerase sigma factor (sigma-70 family)